VAAAMWLQVMLPELKVLTQAAELVAMDLAPFLTKVEALQTQALPPFSDRSMALLAAISKQLLAAPAAKNYPQFIALGYWLRPSMLQRMKHSFESEMKEGFTPTPRGIALHLPPQNVDTLFVYSWAISVLAGNTNIVRLPSNLPESTQELCKLVMAALFHTGEQDRHVFCVYDHRSGINKSISARCDLRMVWGGDAKVRSVSVDPVNPGGLSIGFPDRQSFAVIDANHYRKMVAAEKDQLANNLYNDIFWFDQLGCGSPRVVFWVGDSKGVADDLYNRVANLAQTKRADFQLGVSLGKFALMNELLADGLVQRGHRYGPELDVATGELSPELVTRFHGGGFLASVEINDINDVGAIVNHRTQTIAYHGFDKKQIEIFSKSLVGKGGYRIVPIGEALSFGPVWDGVDLLRHMTRYILYR
jgi:hypothetical protein